MIVLAVDPGDHGGWVTDSLIGGTLPKDLLSYHELMQVFKPDILIVESFRLFGSKAQSQTNSSFFTCEAIGVLKLEVLLMEGGGGCKLVLQAPSVKQYINKTKYADMQKSIMPCMEIPIHKDFQARKKPGVSEHTYDAAAHLLYWQMNN